MSDVREAFAALEELAGIAADHPGMPGGIECLFATVKAALQQSAPAVPDGTVTDYGTKSDHIGDANKMGGIRSFKAFHAALCRRFGYPHDEQFWWRDLVSLEEHIASQMQPDHSPDAGKVECHAPGDRCRACPHYFGKSDRCDYAISPCTAVDAGKVVQDSPAGWIWDAYGSRNFTAGTHHKNVLEADGVTLTPVYTHPAESREEIMAQALEQAFEQLADEYAPYGLLYSYTAFDVAQHIRTQGKHYAARLRASQKEGGER